MVEILKASSKIIALDGDLGNRSYSILNKLRESMHTCNIKNLNRLKLHIIMKTKTFNKG